MKYFWNFCITPLPYHIHFCCWFLPIWSNLNVWAKIGSYGLCWIGWRYNGAKGYFSWPYILASIIWNTSELSASDLICATAICVVECLEFGPSWMFGLKWSWWLVPTWLEVQRSKAVFFLTLYNIINDMKYFRNCLHHTSADHSHFCCWLLPIWPKLDVSAENGAYSLCQIGWWYNRQNIYFSWPYMIISMIWNNFGLSPSLLSRATVIFVVDCWQFGPSWMFGLKIEITACAGLVGGTRELSCIFSDLIC